MLFPSQILNPFPGFKSFNRYERNIFFGREKLLDEFVVRLHDERCLIFTGHSGVGKTSFINAGIVPRLAEEFSGEILFVPFKPDSKPVNSLVKSFLHSYKKKYSLQESSRTISHVYKNGSSAFLDFVKTEILTSKQKIFLFIDQFEDFLRIDEKKYPSFQNEENNIFQSLLLDLFEQKELPFYVCVAFRDDFLDVFKRYNIMGKIFEKNPFFLENLSESELKLAIINPIQTSGKNISENLVEKLIREIIDEEYQLPILQFILKDIWERSKDKSAGKINITYYREIGAAKENVSKKIDEVFNSLGEEGKSIAQWLFTSLIHIDSAGRITSVPKSISYFEETIGLDADDLAKVADLFFSGGRDLVNIYPDEIGENFIIELSHECIPKLWNRYGKWVKTEMESSREYLYLINAMQTYQSDKSNLLSGPQLETAKKWLKSKTAFKMWAAHSSPQFGEVLDYITKSEENEYAPAFRRQKRKYFFRNFLLLIFFATLLIVLFKKTLIPPGLQEKNTVFMNSTDSTTMQKIIDKKTRVKEDIKHEKSTAPNQLLTAKSKENIPARDFTKARPGKVSGENKNTKQPNPSQIKPDIGQQLKVVTAEQFINSAQMVLKDNDWLRAAHFYAYSIANDENKSRANKSWVQLQKLIKLVHLDFQLNPQNLVEGFAVTHSGKSVALWYSDGLIQLLKTETQFSSPISINSDGKIWGVSFKPGGKILMTWNDKKNINFWNVADGSRALRTITFPSKINGAMFNKDGNLFLSWCADGLLWLRYSNTGVPKFKAWQFYGSIKQAILSNTERFIFTSGFNGSANLVDLNKNGGKITLLSGMDRNGILGGMFNKDDSSLLTWTTNELKVWNTELGTLISKPAKIVYGNLKGATISDDGRYILTWDGLNFIKLWKIQESGITLVNTRHSSTEAIGASFCSDNKRILIWFANGFAYLYNKNTLKSIVRPMLHGGKIRRAKFCNSNKSILTYSDDGSARFWDGTTGVPRSFSLRHVGPVRKAELCNNEKNVITWSQADNTIKIWELSESSLKKKGYNFSEQKRGIDILKNNLQIVIEVFTGTTMDTAGNLHLINSTSWQKKKNLLESDFGRNIFLSLRQLKPLY